MENFLKLHDLVKEISVSDFLRLVHEAETLLP
jgi:hypothetical protein